MQGEANIDGIRKEEKLPKGGGYRCWTSCGRCEEQTVQNYCPGDVHSDDKQGTAPLTRGLMAGKREQLEAIADTV
ncbi:hypothetical protein C0Q70_16124 [Pomacea canaliculata]|uniref:Uncharacterized protein n=1 Tax=Pomacea canaliculata TaxID=400727 RepID=A0A2T7NNW5_POMCA|nr:hypothetical protein C0Q70_16124 [Pomacea canaliculata]